MVIIRKNRYVYSIVDLSTHLILLERIKQYLIQLSAYAWEQRKLGELTILGSSKRVHRENYVEKGIPFFRGSEISKLRNSSVLKDVSYISQMI